MRHIVKGKAPSELVDWLRSCSAKPKYEDMPAEAVRAPLRLALLAEQFYLCAYTMKAIKTLQNGFFDCHIEHVVARGLRRGMALETDWTNLVACVPLGKSPGYGARLKPNSNEIAAAFVSPLDSGCEARFDFQFDGSVLGKDDGANKTIKALNLNHEKLVAHRKSTYRGLGILKERGRGSYSSDNMEAGEAEQLSISILSPDDKDRLAEFCVAIAQFAKKFAMAESEFSAALPAPGKKP